jgi:hypothetical protein
MFEFITIVFFILLLAALGKVTKEKQHLESDLATALELLQQANKSITKRPKKTFPLTK